MKMIKKILPDLLAVGGAACIVVALWMVSPVYGLLATGAALIGAAIMVSMPISGGKRK